MRHFSQIPAGERGRLFHLEPGEFGPDGEPRLLGVALGATLYLPATRGTLAADIAKQAARGVTSMVICLEDAIADEDVPAAETNAVAGLRAYAASASASTRPLLFLRVRRPEQIPDLVDRLGLAAELLTGFVVPKFTDVTGAAYLDALTDTAQSRGLRLLAMPVLESAEVIYRETRTDALTAIARLLVKYRAHVVAVRIGAADLCSTYGLRRSRDVTVYDLRLVADVIADIVNVLGRAGDTGFVVAGPAWEYFSGAERMFKPQLRQTPFAEHDPAALRLRSELIAADLDGLIREVVLDKANGLTGKTVIHPDHVAAVHAVSVVTHEEYSDATAILDTEVAGGGVLRSAYANKMNEVKPHRAWAHAVLRRAAVFGVAHPHIGFVDLLGASAPG